MMVSHDKSGREQEMAAVDRKTFAMWLASIVASRLKNPVVRAKIVLYQCEAADVLDRHFFGSPVAAPAPTFDLAEPPSFRDSRGRLGRA